MFERAINSLRGDYLATGHYARVQLLNGASRLFTAIDATKDQSYFLSGIEKEKLDRVLFPVGHLQKSTVRKIAEECKLRTATKKESMGICFIGEKKNGFKKFLGTYTFYNFFFSLLEDYIEPTNGSFISVDGTYLGKNKGPIFYTIGENAKIPNMKKAYVEAYFPHQLTD